MKHIRLSLLLFSLLWAGAAWAQENIVEVNNQNNGRTYDVSQQGINATDDGGPFGNYAAGIDYYIIVTANCDGNNILRIQVTNIDIAPTDTLFIYDGAYSPGANLFVLAEINNDMIPDDLYFYPTQGNTSHTLSIRFKSDANSTGGTGFYLPSQCALPCVSLNPHMQDRYYKARNGVIYDSSMFMGDRIQIDTLWQFNVVELDDSTTYNDTTGFELTQTPFWGLEICEGDSLIIKAYGEYGTGGFYTPTDRTSTFNVDWSDGETTSVTGQQCNGYIGHKYKEVGCYDLSLRLADYIGCESSSQAEVRVRIALMPLKTLFDLQTMCNTDSLLVNVGYDGDGATLTLKKIEFSKTATKTNPIRTFIPDGPHCADPCYEAPVTFNEFPSGRTVHSADDICSICLNYEHTFMGDYRTSIVCPTGKESIIKFGNSSMDHKTPKADAEGQTFTYDYGGGCYTGFPNRSWDSDCDASGSYQPDPNATCDSTCNPFGEGLEYCWSRNAAYTLVTGELANIGTHDRIYENPADPTGPFIYENKDTYVVDRHINSSSATYKIQETHTYGTVPAYFNSHPGDSYGTKDVTTKMPSNHEEKTDYYLPDADFSELIGCPLNGEWKMRVCDYWGADNGWIFSWSMDICGISSGGCEYQVGIDSVTWTPDTLDGDFDLGHWRGATLWPNDSIRTWIATPDTAGSFRIHVKIYDEFGCVWDSITRITTVWNPVPQLPDNINVCGVETVILDATDPHTATSNQTYRWEPYGDSTATIETRPLSGGYGSQLYTVQVTNTQHDIRCTNRDSVRVNFYKTPIANFDPGIYPLEGCEPFTIRFQNMSQYGSQYFWDFGDGYTSTAESPVHSYATGQYDLKYYITSADGCKDSLIFPRTVTVFPAPIAKFSWEPINPTVLHPEVTFINRTEPQTDAVKFYWEVQYDRNNPLSYHTMTELNPSFTWQTDGEDISGPYIARLIAKTDERGPSGHVLECRDTVENTILLVNDFLQFPNVITANGDGINDVFEIKNLVNGMGYPNNSLAIYNRWGKRVYFKTNISSEEDFWDPAKDNIPAGTYFWRFSGKGYLGDIERNGVVEVLR